MRTLAIAAIGGYQRFVSPHKGFCCAYRANTGHDSCSDFAIRALRRVGLLDGLRLTKRRLACCRQSFIAMQLAPRRKETEAERSCLTSHQTEALCCGVEMIGCCF